MNLLISFVYKKNIYLKYIDKVNPKIN